MDISQKDLIHASIITLGVPVSPFYPHPHRYINIYGGWMVHVHTGERAHAHSVSHILITYAED